MFKKADHLNLQIRAKNFKKVFDRKEGEDNS
jgi:hypothetical protein